MNENLTPNKNLTKSKNRKIKFLLRALATILLFACVYWVFKFGEISKIKDSFFAEKEVIQNFEDDEIFDFTADFSGDIDSESSKEGGNLKLSDVKIGGVKLLYQELLRDRAQIKLLNSELKEIKAEIFKYKNREKINKMMVAYVDLRQEFLRNGAYQDYLANFEILIDLDENLLVKLEKLKTFLPNFVNQENLENSFEKLIPDLIALKSSSQHGGIIEKVSHNISKLVTIRKIDGKGDEIDVKILEVENFLKQEKYQNALNILQGLDEQYQEVLSDFLSDLKNAIELRNVDQEILIYLKNLS